MRGHSLCQTWALKSLMGLASANGRERKGAAIVLVDVKSPGSVNTAQTGGRAQKKGAQQHLC